MIESVGHDGEIDMPIDHRHLISTHFSSQGHYLARRLDYFVDFIQESFRLGLKIV